MTIESQVDVVQIAEQLLAWFDRSRRYVIALSGGVDSAVVAKAASLARLQAVAVTARSASVAQRELRDAAQLAESLCLRHEFVEPLELEDTAYLKNDARRCYYCKTRLYTAIRQRFPQYIILSGTNLDDLSDYRPGLQAASESEVRAPLAELSIDKQLVRLLAKHWALSIADKPASPCLASRIAHGVPVTAGRLSRIEQAEELLRGFGLVEFRVRLHEGEVARLEIHPDDIVRLAQADVRRVVVASLQQLGFRFVTLDLEGFRTGSLNPPTLPFVQLSSLSRLK